MANRGEGGRSCYNCGETGHFSRECGQPRKPRDQQSSSSGGWGSDSPRLSSSKPNNCYNCGVVGHLMRDCTQPRKPAGNCYNCDKPGHLSRDCSEPRKARNQSAANNLSSW